MCSCRATAAAKVASAASLIWHATAPAKYVHSISQWAFSGEWRRKKDSQHHGACCCKQSYHHAGCSMCAGTWATVICCPAPSACCRSVHSLGLAAHARAAILPEALHPPSCLLHRQGVSVHPVLPYVGQTTAVARLVRAGGHCAQHSSIMCAGQCAGQAMMVLAGSWHVQECWEVTHLQCQHNVGTACWFPGIE